MISKNPIRSYVQNNGFKPVLYMGKNFLFRNVKQSDGTSKREFYFYKENFLLIKIPMVGFANMIMAKYVGLPFPALTFDCDFYKIHNSFTWSAPTGIMQVKLYPKESYGFIDPELTHVLEFRLLPEFPVTISFNLARAHKVLTEKKKLRKFIGLHTEKPNG